MISTELHDQERAPSASADERGRADRDRRRHAMIEHGVGPIRVRSDLCRIEPVPRRGVKSTLRRMRGDVLTDRQQEVLKRIREHVRECGMPPSRSELARTLGLAFGSAVNYHLKALERKGWIRLTPGRDRGIQLLREGAPVFDAAELPAVAAGTPILADEKQASFRVPEALARRIHPRADFYLVVRGDSMELLGYRSGDILAVQREPNPRRGDVVIARIGSEITVKCFHQVGKTEVELRPRSANSEHESIVIDEKTEDWEIVGVVVGAMVGAPSAADAGETAAL